MIELSKKQVSHSQQRDDLLRDAGIVLAYGFKNQTSLLQLVHYSHERMCSNDDAKSRRRV